MVNLSIFWTAKVMVWCVVYITVYVLSINCVVMVTPGYYSPQVTQGPHCAAWYSPWRPGTFVHGPGLVWGSQWPTLPSQHAQPSSPSQGRTRNTHHTVGTFQRWRNNPVLSFPVNTALLYGSLTWVLCVVSSQVLVLSLAWYNTG